MLLTRNIRVNIARKRYLVHFKGKCISSIKHQNGPQLDLKKPDATETLNSSKGKNCNENFRDKKRKMTFQQFISTQNFHLQFMDNSAAEAKQDVSFRHRQLYIADNQTKGWNHMI